MKKLVNGKVVDIHNIELFELAEKAIAMCNVATSSVGIKTSSIQCIDRVSSIVGAYNIIVNAMPYPLYAVEQPVKYAIAAWYIKMATDEKEMFIDNGLHVVIDRKCNTAVHICGSTFSIESIDMFEDNTNLSNFKDNVGYNEFLWFKSCVEKADFSTSIYEEFMPEFVDACNNDEMIIRWELAHILNFASFPKEIYVVDNIIRCIDNDIEYYIEITKNNNKSSIYENETHVRTVVKRYKEDNAKYDYNTYKIASNGNREKTNNMLTASLFYILYSEKVSGKLMKFPTYKGFVIGSKVVVEVCNNIYIYDYKHSSHVEPIISCARIYSVDTSTVYIEKEIDLGDVIKVNIYGVKVSNSNVRLCRTQYRRRNS